MKKIFILFLLFGILGACKKDEPFIAPIDQLPPATQEGANTSGCLVDGEAFIELRNRSCQYVNQRNFSFGISNEVNGKHYHVLISMKNTELDVGKTYQLTEEFGENTKAENTNKVIDSNKSVGNFLYSRCNLAIIFYENDQKELALNEKQYNAIGEWQDEKINDTYIKISESHRDCDFSSNWLKNK